MQKYSISSRAIHWLMALLIFFMLGLGIYMTKILPKDASNHLEIYSLHKSFGVVALIFVTIRILNRLICRAPALPTTMPKYEQILAHLGHFGLYVLMILVPLSGYLMSNSFGFPVHLFAIELPFLVEQNIQHGQFFAFIHWLSAYGLIGLLAAHIGAVVKHRFFDKPENDVLKRMI